MTDPRPGDPLELVLFQHFVPRGHTNVGRAGGGSSGTRRLGAAGVSVMGRGGRVTCLRGGIVGGYLQLESGGLKTWWDEQGVGEPLVLLHGG